MLLLSQGPLIIFPVILHPPLATFQLQTTAITKKVPTLPYLARNLLLSAVGFTGALNFQGKLQYTQLLSTCNHFTGRSTE